MGAVATRFGPQSQVTRNQPDLAQVESFLRRQGDLLIRAVSSRSPTHAASTDVFPSSVACLSRVLSISSRRMTCGQRSSYTRTVE